MKQKLIFQSRNKKNSFKFLKSNKQKLFLNFLNLHDMYQFNKEPIFKKSLLENKNINFIDGFIISAYLSLVNLKKVPRIRGPTFTKDFLSNPNLSKDKTHFFIGLEKQDLKKLQKKFSHLKKASAYNPSYIKELKFPNEEIKKITSLINKARADCIWVGIGCPKQNILSSELSEKTNAQYFMNVGAALDFLLGKKTEAPLIIRKLGIEWLYRLMTDFKYSKKKVWRSLISLKYLINIRLEK
jgi:N-acetylglucosaminyldiphosphoundecaprenol N-acetyl-beta-D-mannosaminyltransferase